MSKEGKLYQVVNNQKKMWGKLTRYKTNNKQKKKGKTQYDNTPHYRTVRSQHNFRVNLRFFLCGSDLVPSMAL